MHQHWRSNIRTPPATLMDAALLSDAHVTCVGHPRDEELCRQVADLLLHLGWKPGLGSRYQRARLAEGVSTSRSIANLRVQEEEHLVSQGRYPGRVVDQGMDADLDLESDASCESDHPLRGVFRRRSDVLDAQKRAREAGAPKLTMSVRMQSEVALCATHVPRMPLYHPTASLQGRSGLRSWLESDAGKTWRSARDARLRAAFEEDDHED